MQPLLTKRHTTGHASITDDTELRALHVRLCDLDDHLACYSRKTGTTHVLDALTGEALRIIHAADEARTTRNIAMRLAKILEVQPDDLLDQLRKSVDLLLREQLAEAQPPHVD